MSYIAPFSSYRAVLVTFSLSTEKYIFLTHSFMIISANITINHILLRTVFFELRYYRIQYEYLTILT